MATIKLFGRNGKLCFTVTDPESIRLLGTDVRLVIINHGEDIDTFSWPLDLRYRSRELQLRQIRLAMSDYRECGRISLNVDSAELPDGTVLQLV